MKRGKQIVVVLIYLLLLLLAVPWYWPADDSRQLGGFPLWVLMTLSVAFCASLFTAWNLMHSSAEKETEN